MYTCTFVSELLQNAISIYTSEDLNQPVAYVAFMTWATNENYDSFEVDALEWLNCAGELAEELGSNEDDSCIIFRDYFYQVSVNE